MYHWEFVEFLIKFLERNAGNLLTRKCTKISDAFGDGGCYVKGDQKKMSLFCSMVCKIAFCQNITKRTKILESGA